ncbi:hypothetical protein STH313 [Symbiobacterium thermophilum IAM 14863]|uniref:Uncharacterized protein n=1 Tax=Symbiobacterium thermophilum (strain DSM 24528 / JCM 14929 / IAM 14863 / T) TaxID=292459 RepID=Q67SP5_SYMTH|nr:hypothetical protein STH313 [Symbiobacterium thermophilum IAM 14863]
MLHEPWQIWLRPSCFNPHPALGPAATGALLPLQGVHSLVSILTQPTPRATGRASDGGREVLGVSILARPWIRVLPAVTVEASRVTGFQEPGATPRVELNCPLIEHVSILTRTLGRVLRATASYQSEQKWPILTRSRGRVLGNLIRFQTILSLTRMTPQVTLPLFQPSHSLAAGCYGTRGKPPGRSD